MIYATHMFEILLNIWNPLFLTHLRERHINGGEILEGQEVIDHQHGQGSQQRKRKEPNKGESSHDSEVEALGYESTYYQAPREVLEEHQQDVDEDSEADQEEDALPRRRGVLLGQFSQIIESSHWENNCRRCS